MPLYKIKDCDIFVRGERHSEGSEISLDEKETKGIEKYLEKIEEEKKGGKK